jgi:hypothetical protein
VRPQLFVHLPASSGVSFYDFVLDYVARRAGQFVYDHGTSKYALRATKPSGTAVKAFGDDLGRVRRVFPEVRRTTPRLLNTSTEDPRTLAQQAPLAVTPFRHDELTRTPIAQSLDAASRTLESTLSQRGVEVELEFVRVPAVSYVPGTLVSFESARRFGQRGALEGATLRVFELRLEAQALQADADADRGAPNAAYRVSLEARLEAQDDTTARLPAHRAPAYPGYVEGKIVSHVGTDTERTYDFIADQDTSLKYYEVTLPVFASQTVRVPFEPHHLSGNVYIPAYRDARVLLAYWLEDARVERLLDWREGVPLAKDSQGSSCCSGARRPARPA